MIDYKKWEAALNEENMSAVSRKTRFTSRPALPKLSVVPYQNVAKKMNISRRVSSTVRVRKCWGGEPVFGERAGQKNLVSDLLLDER